MSTEKTVAECWASYQRDIVPAGAPAVQVQECRRAFYAGAAAGIQLLARAAEANDDEIDDELQRLHDEMDKFTQDVLAGRA